MFVKLTRYRHIDSDGNPREDYVWVNFDNIVGFEPCRDQTMIYGVGETSPLVVHETFEEVAEKAGLNE